MRYTTTGPVHARERMEVILRRRRPRAFDEYPSWNVQCTACGMCPDQWGNLEHLHDCSALDEYLIFTALAGRNQKPAQVPAAVKVDMTRRDKRKPARQSIPYPMQPEKEAKPQDLDAVMTFTTND